MHIIMRAHAGTNRGRYGGGGTAGGILGTAGGIFDTAGGSEYLRSGRGWPFSATIVGRVL